MRDIRFRYIVEAELIDKYNNTGEERKYNWKDWEEIL